MRKRRFLAIGLAALLAGAIGLGWCWFEARARQEAHQPFWGTWRWDVCSVDPTGPRGQVWDFGLQPDGTVDMRLWDPRTGVVACDVKAQNRWRVVDGRLQTGHYGRPLLNDLGLGRWNVVLRDGPVTWHGPDRFEYADDKSSLGPQRWVRVDPANAG